MGKRNTNEESEPDNDYFSSPEYWESVEEQAIQIHRAKKAMDAILRPFTTESDFDSPIDYSKIYDHMDSVIRENLDSKSIWEFIFLAGDQQISAKAKMHAMHRMSTDPKQKAKQQVRECWELWQGEKGRYKSKAAFAKDMLDKFERLESQRVIERWCKEWETEPS